jgi:hypothetical protein
LGSNDRQDLQIDDPKNKKMYSTPKVKVYGAIWAITNAIAHNTKGADGGTGKTDKTA